MRTFNEREKDFLKKLSNLDAEFKDEPLVNFTKVLSSLVFDKDQNELLIFNAPMQGRSEKVTALFSAYTPLSKESKLSYRHFIELLGLYDYLVEIGWIHTWRAFDFPEDSIEIISSISDMIDERTFPNKTIISTTGLYLDRIDYHIKDKNDQVKYFPLVLDKNVNAKIKQCNGCVIFITEELIQYVKNDFRTKDDINNRRNLVAAWFGIGIAIISSIISIWVTIALTQ